MDENEHVISRSLGKRLVAEETGLDLVEILHQAWGGIETNTHIDDTHPINEVWASRSLEVRGFKIFSFQESIGDHRTMIFDVTACSLIGVYKLKVVRSGCRCLNCQTSSRV